MQMWRYPLRGGVRWKILGTVNKRVLSQTWTKSPVASITWQRDMLCPKRAVCCHNFKETLEMKSSVVLFFLFFKVGSFPSCSHPGIFSKHEKKQVSHRKKGETQTEENLRWRQASMQPSWFSLTASPTALFPQHAHSRTPFSFHTSCSPKNVKSETCEILPGFKISLSSSPTSGYSQHRDLPSSVWMGLLQGREWS